MELSQLHSSLGFRATFGYQSGKGAIFPGCFRVFKHVLVQENMVTLLLLVLLAYFNVSGNEDDLQQNSMQEHNVLHEYN